MGFSLRLMSFWLSEIVNAAHEHNGNDWRKDHNCRYLLNQLVGAIYVLQPAVEGGPDGLAPVDQFIQQQTKLFSPKHDKKGLDFTPPLDLLSSVKPHEASKHYPWLTFQCVIQAGVLDRAAWLNLGAVVLEYPQSMPLKDILKRKKLGKEVLWECIVRRWASYALFVEPDHPLLPIFWQMFFAFYFAKIPNIIYGKGNESGCFGYRFLEGKSGATLSAACRDRLRHLSKFYFSLAARSEHLVIHQKLGTLFHAMELWLKKPFNQLLSDLQFGRASAECCPERLTTLLLNDISNPTRKNLWWDLVDHKLLRHKLERRCHSFFPAIETLDKLDQHDEKVEEKVESLHETPTGPPGLSRTRKIRSTSACEMKIPPVVNAKGLTLVIPQCLRIPMYNAMAGNSSKECIFTIRTCCKMYSERLSLHLGLDAQIIDYTPQLYRNADKETRIEKGCNRFTGCSGRAVFIFHHQEAMRINAVSDLLALSRRRVAECAETTDVTLEFCAELLRISRVIRHLLSIQKSPETHQIGQDWLFNLIELDSSELREYPPTKHFIQRAIKSLGQMFILSNLANQIKLLRTLSHHPYLIDSLFHAVNPPFSHFVELFRVAVTIMDPNKRAVPQILQRFDIEGWLGLNPSLSDRREIFRICAASLRDEMAKSKNLNSDENPICLVIASMISRVAAFNFPELYREYVALNLAGSRSREILPNMWSQLANFPMNALSWDNIQGTLTQISNTLWNHRYALDAQKSRHTLYTAWGLYIPDMFVFIKRLFELSATHVIRTPEIIHRVWAAVWQVFGPWLASSIQKDQNNQGPQPEMKASFPWHKEDLVLSQSLLRSFVAVIEAIAKYDQNNTLSRVWNLYSNNLIPNADYHIVTEIQKAISDVKWEVLPWRVDVNVIGNMARVLKNCTLNSKKALIADFLSYLLNKVDWTASTLIPQESSAYTIEFLSLIISILAELVIPMRDHTTELLYAIRKYHWGVLSVEDYQSLLENISQILYGPRWDHLQEISAKEENKFSNLPISGTQSPKDIVTAEDRASYILDLMRILSTGFCPILQPEIDMIEQEEKEAPVTLPLQKLRLFSEWILSTFQEKGPVPLAHPKRYALIAVQLINGVHTFAERVKAPRDTYIEILQEFISLVNLPDKGSPVPREIRGVIDFIFDKRPNLAMYALTASCRMILSVNTLSVASERCIDAMFATKHQRNWPAVLQALEAPEINEKEFLDLCIQNGSVNTLQACARIKFTNIKHHYNPIEAQSLLGEIVSWLKELDMQAGDHTKLIPFWWTVLDWQVNVISELRNGDPSKLGANAQRLSHEMIKLANSVMKTLYKHIAKYSLDKKTGGLLGAIGLGHKSRHSLEFRVAARAMSTFIICQSDGKYNFFWSASNSSMKKTSTIHHKAKTIEEFRRTAENKHYASLTKQIENIHAYLKTADIPLADFRPVFRHICAVLYPDLPNLLPFSHHASISE